MKKRRTLKGMTLVENIIAFVIILGVLALALAGLTVSANYIQRGRSTTEASETAEALMERMYSITLSITSDDDRASILNALSDDEKECVTISDKTTVTINPEDTTPTEVTGRFVTVKVKVDNKSTVERFVTYSQFVPTKDGGEGT